MQGIMKEVEAVAEVLRGHAPEVRILSNPKPLEEFRDQSTVFVIPSRGKVDTRVVDSWLHLIKGMNQKHAYQFARGYKVDDAYNALIAAILADPTYSRWTYVCTLEDDNIPPPEAFIALIETIEHERAPDGKPYDAVSALYYGKDDRKIPLCFGSWEKYRETGEMDFSPLDLSVATREVVPVCGIPQGCAVWRMDLFREIKAPWFQTTTEGVHAKIAAYKKTGKKSQVMTQDMHFCRRATEAGKRFAVDLRVRVGHLDTSTGRVY